MLLLDDCFLLDIDNCGMGDPLVQELLGIFSSTYAEKSFSGNGVHILGRYDANRIPADCGMLNSKFYMKHPTNNLELYLGGFTNRFSVFTGDPINDLPIADCSDGVIYVLNHYMQRDYYDRKDSIEVQTSSNDKVGKNLSAEEIIAKLSKAKNNEKFLRLFQDGDISGYSSQSEAELALCSLIAFYTSDFETIDKIVRNSKLFRSKWNRTDYCERTIAKAIEFVSQNQEAYYRDNVFNSDVFDADVSDTSDAINKNVNKEWAEKLTEENFLNRETFERIFRIQDKIERAEIITLIYSKAKEFNRVKDFSRLFKAHQEEVEKQLKKGGNFMNFPQPPLSGLNCGAWHCEPDGVYRMCVKENEPRMVFACRHPILPTKRLISAYGSEKIEISFFRDGKWQSFIVSRLQISSSAKIVELANRGIDVTTESSKELIKFLTDMIMNNLDKIPVCESISRLGWVKEDFIPYVNHIAFDGDPNYQNLFDDVQKSGDYSIWKEHCLKIRKNIFLRLIMAANFASPLIEKLGLSPFVFHLWGESGCGKTVGLCVAMSIWGNPAPGHLTRTLNMTKTAMAKNAAFLYSIPFAGDELQIVKNQFNYDLNNLIMYLSEGIDRGRANSSGGLDRLLTWNNTFLFTGEEPITKSNSGGGTKNRVIEVEVKGSVVENGNETASLVKSNYGHAGPIFVESLLKEDLQSQFHQIVNQLSDSCDSTEKQIMAMSLILLADKLAVKYIFTEEIPLDSNDVKNFLTSKNMVDVSIRAHEWISNWIAQNYNNFSMSSNYGKVWGRIDKKSDVTEVLVNKDVLSAAMKEASFDLNSSLLRKMSERNQIRRNSQNKFVHQTTIHGIKSTYICFLFGNDDFEEMAPEETPFD